MKKIVLLSLLLIVFIFTFGTNNIYADSNVMKLKMQAAYPPGDSSFDVHCVEMAKMIKEVSQGRVDVEIFPPGALIAFTEMNKALQYGMVDLAHLFGPIYSGALPMGDIVAGLPFAWIHGEVGMEECVELFFDKKYRLIDVVREAYAEKGQFFLVPSWCNSYPFMLNFPMTKISDLKGRKLRGSGSVAKWLQKVGAATVTIPGVEVYMAMKMGTIDGTPFPAGILENQKLKEVVKYAVYPGLAGPNLTHAFSMKTWQKLPSDVRTALLDEKRLIDFYRRTGKLYIAGDDRDLASAMKYGVKKIDLSKDVQKEARMLALSIWDEIATKDKHCAKAVEIIKRYQKDKGGI